MNIYVSVFKHMFIKITNKILEIEIEVKKGPFLYET